MAGIITAITAAPEASAVPAFARQTGMACNACHFQHFPLLNEFGRSFKVAGYTMMGTQAKIEGDNISLPRSLNMGVQTMVVYDRTSGANNATNYDKTAGDQNQWNVPGGGGSLSLFFGGRVSEHAGFLSETGLGSGAATTAAKLVNMYDVDDAKVGLVVYQNNLLGAAYGFELLNTGAVRNQKMTALNGSLIAIGGPGTQHDPGSEHVAVYSAAQYLNTATDSTGISLVASNSSGSINIGKWEMAGVGANANQLPLTYLRLVHSFSIEGLEAAVGLQNYGGTSNLTKQAPNATIVDFQLQGLMLEKSVGIYASYGSAEPSSSAIKVNPFNGGRQSRSSLNIGATVEVISRVVLQAAYRSGKSGLESVPGNGSNLTDNAYLVGASYQLTQNQELSLTYTSKSGTLYSDLNATPNFITGTSAGSSTLVGKSVMSLMLETLF